jgi:hypothetical protein
LPPAEKDFPCFSLPSLHLLPKKFVFTVVFQLYAKQGEKARIPTTPVYPVKKDRAVLWKTEKCANPLDKSAVFVYLDVRQISNMLNI